MSDTATVNFELLGAVSESTADYLPVEASRMRPVDSRPFQGILFWQSSASGAAEPFGSSNVASEQICDTGLSEVGRHLTGSEKPASPIIGAVWEVQRPLADLRAHIREAILPIGEMQLDVMLPTVFIEAKDLSTSAVTNSYTEVASQIARNFDEARRFVSFMRVLACGTAADESKEQVSTAKTLKVFKGKVINFKDGEAEVILEDQEGHESHASCDASDLTTQGICSGDVFTCKVVKRGRASELVFERVPRKKLTSEEVSELRGEIANSLTDFGDDG